MANTIYKWTYEWDVPEEDLIEVFQQPQADLVAPVVRDYGAGGEITEQGLFCCYHFSHVDDAETWQAILAQVNLMDNDSYPITFLAKNNRLVLKRYNGVAQIPEANQDVKWSNFFPRDMAIYMVDVEEAA
jgi:hypothetical protein